MRGKKTFARVAWVLLTVLWIGFIFCRSLQPADVSSEESGAVLELAHRVFPFLSMFALRKLAHFTEFLILGVLLHFAFRSFCLRSDLFVLGTGLAVAAADELLQLLSPGRSCQITDVLLDFFGVAVSVLLFFVFHIFSGRKAVDREREKR